MVLGFLFGSVNAAAAAVGARRVAAAASAGSGGRKSAGSGGGGGAGGAAKKRVGKRRGPEREVRDALARALNGRTEVGCSCGYVDVVTDAEVIEVKSARNWKAALGQVLAYSREFPGKRPRVHLFGEGLGGCDYSLCAAVCREFGVDVTREPDPAADKGATALAAALAAALEKGATEPAKGEKGAIASLGESRDHAIVSSTTGENPNASDATAAT